MSDLFALFSESQPEPAASHATQPVFEPMSQDQRETIRGLLSELDLRTAKEQFDLVDALVGVRLHAVTELDIKTAARLIPHLRERVASAKRRSTGSSWDDRDEDTWIDNL